MSEGQEWALVSLDEKVARRHGVPPQLPVPKGEIEKLGEKGFDMESVRRWISTFMSGASSSWRQQNNAIASRYDAFIGKTASWQKAEKAFASGQHEQAIAALKMITRLDPNDHAAKMNLAMAQAASGDHASARKGLEEIADTFQGDPGYHTSYGHVCIALGDKDAAVGALVLALEAKPDHQPAFDAMIKIGVLVPVYENPKDAASLTYVRSDSVQSYLEGVWAAEPRSAGYFLDQIAYHQSERRFAVALSAADKGLELAMEPFVRESLASAKACALRLLERFDEALAFADAELGAGESVGLLVEKALCLRAKGDAAGAEAACKLALARSPGDMMALDVAFWPADRNDIAAMGKAVPLLEAHAAAHPAEAGPVRSLARAKLALGANEEALPLFAKAVALAPTDDDLRAEYWSELRRAGRSAEILADAAAIENMRERSWTLRFGEAEALEASGKVVEARGAYMAINADTQLHVDIRKRAKRAMARLGGA